MEGLSCFVGEQVPRGYIRCDFFIVTHCVIVFYVISELSTLRNGVFRGSKIAQDGRTDGRTRISYQDAEVLGGLLAAARTEEVLKNRKKKAFIAYDFKPCENVRCRDDRRALAYFKLRHSIYHRHRCQPEMMGILMRRKMRTTPTHMRVMVFWSIRCDV